MSLLGTFAVLTVIAAAVLAFYLDQRTMKKYERELEASVDQFWNDYWSHVFDLPEDRRNFVLEAHGFDPDEFPIED